MSMLRTFGLEEPIDKGGATNLKVGGQCIGRWGVNTRETQNLKKVGVHDPSPPSSYGCAASDNRSQN